MNVIVLLDTHIALWAVAGSAKLSRRARAALEDRRNTIFVSAASLWEIAVKHGTGRKGSKSAVMPASQALIQFRASGFRFLPVTPEHAVAVEDLPNRHGDPFDRLLVAQALTEPMKLLTHDETVASYSDTIILV